MQSIAIDYNRATTDQELEQILSIQQRNIKSSLSSGDFSKEGFVTVEHELDVLRRMNYACAHIIAKHESKVVGYALAMESSFARDIPVLRPLIQLTDQILTGVNYLIMGQICIDKPYRKMGIFSGMYRFYRKQLQLHYPCLVTEVATENQRSLQAHLHLGFEILHTRIENGMQWELLVWYWNADERKLTN